MRLVLYCINDLDKLILDCSIENDDLRDLNKEELADYLHGALKEPVKELVRNITIAPKIITKNQNLTVVKGGKK